MPSGTDASWKRQGIIITGSIWKNGPTREIKIRAKLNRIGLLRVLATFTQFLHLAFKEVS